MRPFVVFEFLLIAFLAVALIVKPPPRQAVADTPPARVASLDRSTTSQVAATQPATQEISAAR